MLRKYFQKSGIGRASVQTLRHTFGVHQASKGMSMKTLQDAMGHKDVRSAMIYTSLTGKMRNEMRNNTH
jgi:site-specific recombinase XerD